MLIRCKWAADTLVFSNSDGGYVFACDNWLTNLKPEAMLTAFLGMPVAGWWVLHETREWLADMLEFVSKLNREQVAVFALRDLANLQSDDVHVSASTSLAVFLFRQAFACSTADAQLVVQMNVSLESVA